MSKQFKSRRRTRLARLVTFATALVLVAAFVVGLLPGGVPVASADREYSWTLSGVTLIARIAGLLLAAIAVQMIANSVTAFIAG